MSGPNLAWAVAVNALCHALDVMPLPSGTSEGEVGRWRVVVNNASVELTHRRADKPPVELPPFEVYVEHLDYVSFGLLGPAGGMIGGYSEDQFIDDMVANMSAEGALMFADEIGYRKETKQ